LVNTKNNTFFNKKKLKHIFSLRKANNNETVMSCGSSVAASSLALAYSMINDEYINKIYIGSWSEYGKK
jgi:thiosulfate/3-mercaptopyruvate sulfurtransferase